MGLLSKFKSFLRRGKKVRQPQAVLSRLRIAQHEAAHGIVWYLFRDNWLVNSLTIERAGLPDERMNGALHITANFDVIGENSIERANELFAISLAGMIGQNITLIEQGRDLVVEMTLGKTYQEIFDTTGCGGDFEIAKNYLPYLGNEFRTPESLYVRYKIMDLISLFYDHEPVRFIHAELSQLLMQRGVLTREELLNFFEGHNFSQYIEEENLDINFFHRR